MDDRRTAAFRKQHEDIKETVESILELLNPEDLKKNSHGIRKLLAKLSSMVKIHLILEDKALYPVLANIEEGNIRSISEQYKQEMSEIASVFNDYVAKWSSGGSIRDDTEVFITETRNVFEALLDRVERENSSLYRMLDAL
jgi:iron-sulfur cluster repair protein YtfE (RIC family)